MRITSTKLAARRGEQVESEALHATFIEAEHQPILFRDVHFSYATHIVSVCLARPFGTLRSPIDLVVCQNRCIFDVPKDDPFLSQIGANEKVTLEVFGVAGRRIVKLKGCRPRQTPTRGISSVACC